ncbi:inositol monophosphatase family protein [Oculatella sp. LEGE 06141]|uniref:inositol monophosphatase family protein n=1 Tax=Oculatella sp. LEGE 06141 TaxID=1828648 RepID=UPI00188269EC|nr:inositol monophosphatase family protein [Oculatella sp. LEGE 06141]MBE9178800.1 inositol monophosphatase family protein [Oculatella sp. LEGE 06141]
MTEFWTDVLTFAETTTARVGAQLLNEFGQVTAAEKADGSLVTQADRWADEELRGAIAQAFPAHGVLSEEVEHIFPDQDWCWIIDPIDGTTNFARGVPIWGISLGLLYQGTPVFGYVHLPPIAQSFYGYWYGTSGLSGPTGAFLNHQPIHASTDAPSANHFFNLCARSTSVLQNPVPCKIRMLGVATYNLLTIAAGIALGGVEATPKIWDIAAVWAIVQAAGAAWVPLETDPIFPLKVGEDYSQRSYPTLVVSQPELTETFLPLVRSVANRSANPSPPTH